MTKAYADAGYFARNVRTIEVLIDSDAITDGTAAVGDGHAALDALINRVANLPTPAGPTPHEIAIPATAPLLPIVDATNRRLRGGCVVRLAQSCRRPFISP